MANGHGNGVWMGQATSAAAWWPSEGLSTVQAWDALLARTSKLAAKAAQMQILDWVGRSDTPSAPAERYQVIVNDINSQFSPSTDAEIASLKQRLDQLKSFVAQLESKVKAAEQSSGTLPASSEARSTPEQDMMMECVTAGIALLGLIILPLVLD
jgi:hypothetical protein